MIVIVPIIFLAALAGGCSEASKPASAIPSTAMTPAPAAGSSTTPSVPPSATATRIEVVYFHLTQRCVTCLCFEERFNYVMGTYFKDEIKAGTIKYMVLNAQEPQNSAIAKKYGAVGSQLFINRISNGSEQIRDIQEIWDWNCRGNKQGFDSKVVNVISNSMAGD